MRKKLVTGGTVFVSRQMALMPQVKPLAEGLAESYAWFQMHRDAVIRRPYMEYIDMNLRG